MVSGLLNSRNKDRLNSNYHYLYFYLKPYLFRFSLCAVFALVSVILLAFPIRIVGNFVDIIKAGHINRAEIIRTVAVILAFSLSSGVLLYIQRRLITVASRIMEYRIRRDFLDYLHRQPAAFYLKNKTGSIMSRVTNDLSRIRDMIGAGILHVLRTLFNLVVIIIFMLNINVKYTLICLVPVLALPLVSARVIRRMGKLYQILQEKLAHMNSVVQESFAGIGAIKAYNRESWRLDKFTQANQSYFETNMSLAKLMGFIWPLFMFVGSLSTVFLLFFGGKGVMRGTMSIGDLVSLNFYLLMLTWPLISVGWVINLFQRGMAATGRIRTFLSQKIGRQTVGTQPFQNSRIVISDLTFSYPETAYPALRNVSMIMDPGQCIAIVGTVGSGKSTLAHILSRVYDPDRGRVCIGKSDILDISITNLRDNVGMVPQETFLFSDTIRNNVLFGKDVPEKDLEKAIQTSRIIKDIQEMPDGMEQMLGERGINLSGGQKQRVAISRAVLRNPAIIILDDCLSAVDADTETEILEEFEKFFTGRTTIIISHRISAIKHADRIYVMDQGRVVESGTHERLMAQQGLYVKLYERQKIKEELG
jgi:ATP-binding cassette subfamily B protein